MKTKVSLLRSLEDRQSVTLRWSNLFTVRSINFTVTRRILWIRLLCLQTLLFTERGEEQGASAGRWRCCG